MLGPGVYSYHQLVLTLIAISLPFCLPLTRSLAPYGHPPRLAASPGKLSAVVIASNDPKGHPQSQ